MSDERGTAGRGPQINSLIFRAVLRGDPNTTLFPIHRDILEAILDDLDALAAAGDAMDRAIVEALTNGPTAKARMAAALGAWRAARGGLGR